MQGNRGSRGRDLTLLSVQLTAREAVARAPDGNPHPAACSAHVDLAPEWHETHSTSPAAQDEPPAQRDRQGGFGAQALRCPLRSVRRTASILGTALLQHRGTAITQHTPGMALLRAQPPWQPMSLLQNDFGMILIILDLFFQSHCLLQVGALPS